MPDENDSLRPYPLDSYQDKIVSKIVFAKRDLIPRITSFIFFVLTFPFMMLTKYLNKKKSVVENGEEKAANEIGPIYVCTRINAMDSKFLFAVRDGRIWFKTNWCSFQMLLGNYLV